MSHNEDEYFAKENVEKLRRLHQQEVDKLDGAKKAQLKAEFSNRCPSCGLTMQQLPSYQGVTLLRCFQCGGAFVPPEASRHLVVKSAAKEHAVVEAILNWLHHDPGTK
jgi:protein-arginine kinase activator protein McsA